jgi:hypothetical protein
MVEKSGYNQHSRYGLSMIEVRSRRAGCDHALRARRKAVERVRRLPGKVMPAPPFTKSRCI